MWRSTDPKVFAAWQLQLQILAVVVIRDICDHNKLGPIDISDILSSIEKGEKQWLKLLENMEVNL